MTTLTDTNNYLSALINAGADAMSNLYYVQFIGGNIDDKTGLSLTVRNSEISLPTYSQPTDKKNYMTVSLDVPKADISITKSFTVNFRLDSNYELYEFLLKQQAETSVPNLGYTANRVPDEKLLTGAVGPGKGFKVLVYGAKNEITQQNQLAPETLGIPSNYQKLYEFRYCWISDLTPLRYSYSPNPLTIGATINFYEFDDPQSLLLG